MVKATFYIPKNFNDNEPIPEAFLEAIQDFLIVEFGGYSILGEVDGAWKNKKTGEIKHDYSLKFEVALEMGEVAGLKKFLVETKEKLKQEELYFELNKETDIEML